MVKTSGINRFLEQAKSPQKKKLGSNGIFNKLCFACEVASIS